MSEIYWIIVAIVVVIFVCFYKHRFPIPKAEHFALGLLFFLWWLLFSTFKRGDIFAVSSILYICGIGAIAFIIALKSSRLPLGDMMREATASARPIKSMRKKIGKIEIHENVKCGDGVCCWMPPPNLRTWFSNSNVVFELTAVGFLTAFNPSMSLEQAYATY